MKKQHNQYISEYCWQDIRKEVMRVKPNLATVIDEFNPDENFTFLRVKYPFASNIYKDGMLHLPLDNGCIAQLTDHRVPRALQGFFGHDIPPGLILEKSVEVYFKTEDRIMPTNFWGPGNTIGLWGNFDPTPPPSTRKIWNMNAGARSMFMLPKIADHSAHSRIRRKYGIHAYPPKCLAEHIEIFKHLAVPTSAEDGWYCEVLFFNKIWHKHHEHISWLKLDRLLLQEAWEQSYNCRNQMYYDMSWEPFLKAATNRRLKPTPYIINTVKHLTAIAEGIFPGFRPACNQELAAPIQKIQECYMYTYQLKHYAPIIMCPHQLSSEDKDPVYYSLSLPTVLNFVPRLRKQIPNIMNELREIKLLMSILEETLEGLQHTKFEYFHSGDDHFGEILPTHALPSTDPHLMHYPKEFGERNFPYNSSFLRGCIRITNHVDTPGNNTVSKELPRHSDHDRTCETTPSEQPFLEIESSLIK